MKLLLLIALPATSLGQTLSLLEPDDQGSPSPPRSLTLGDSPDDRLSNSTRKFYFFGDSLTDTGNLGRLIGGLGPGYPGFTLSNGPTWPSYLDSSVVGFSEIEANPGLIPPFRSVDFAVALSTTSTIEFAQTGQPFVDFLPNLKINSDDLAFIWGGSNDFLPLARQAPPASPAEISNTIETGTNNLTSAVTNLENQGLQNFAIISLIDLSLAPGISGFDGSSVANQFNTSLKQKLARLPTSSKLLWIDANSFLNDTVNHPSAYGLTNVTQSIAFSAGEGISSTIPPEDQAGYLFYDDIHPSTAVHEQFAAFVASHLRLESDATHSYLVTDALLELDDHSGFDSRALDRGQLDFHFSTNTLENQPGADRRNTQAYRADLDYGLSHRLTIGAEAIYSDGESGRSTFKSAGFGIDALLRGTHGQLIWETGLGLGHLSGNLERDYQTGTFSAGSEHEASLFTLHAAVRNESLSIGDLSAYWELGFKQRLAHRSGTTESGAASLDLAYDSQTLTTTVANFELGLHLSSKLLLELSLNPILARHGGEISATQANGLQSFETSDQSGYDVHTARASLIFAPTVSSNIRATFLIGIDEIWSANLGYGIRF